METKGCAILDHMGKIFICISSRPIDAYVIVLSCGKHIRNVWQPMDALGTQNSKNSMSRYMLELSTPTGDHHLFFGSRNDVCLGASWHIELHMVDIINMIWSHIEEFHV